MKFWCKDRRERENLCLWRGWSTPSRFISQSPLSVFS